MVEERSKLESRLKDLEQRLAHERETWVQTLEREMKEELGAVPLRYEYYCSLVEKLPELHLTIHYFVVDRWEGELKALEAEELLWMPLKEFEKIEVAIDRSAVREYIRTFEGVNK